ncbi:ComEC/Rec2 family competence protein [Mesorhizobium sp. M0400]|uniref:ComEC/Rec2 family competence protein n=1 Tax=Mesorhizobium sp. M0400 TaxID=2956941 RepID=UPI0033381356
MAVRGRGAGEGEDVGSGVSERLLFAAPVPVLPAPALLPVPRFDAPSLPASDPATVLVPAAEPIVRLRRRFRLPSPSRIRNGVTSAVGLELDRGVAFLLVPVFLACGVIVYFALAVEPAFPQPIAIVALAALCAVASRSWPRTRLCFMAALLCALGVLAAKVETWRVGTHMLGSEISTRLTGRVVSFEPMASGRIRLTIDVISTARPTLRYMPERVRVSAMKIPAELTAGSEIAGYVRLLPPTGPVRPDSYEVLFDRAALTMRNLAISAIAVILVSPHEVVGPSFQMSFAATAALVGAYAGWSDYRAGGATTPPPRRSPLRFATRKVLMGMGGLAMTSIIAGSATALFAIWHFQRVAPLSLFANLAIMPIVSLVVMPFAVLSALAMPFGADGPFLYVMGKGLTAMIALSGWISERSPIDAVGLISLRSVLLVTIALVIASMATTWLRLVALPFALAGLLTTTQTRVPDVLISEDARLVALPIGSGELAVNRARPNEFTIDNWKRALTSEAIVAPETPGKNDPQFDIADPADLPPGMPFICTDGLCLARHPSGAIIALANDRDTARPACAFASLIVIDDATAHNPCYYDRLVLVVTKRQLARAGSAAVYFDPQAATRAEIRFAVEKSYRPWHVQRKFSRAARGMPPYRRADKPKAGAKGAAQ